MLSRDLLAVEERGGGSDREEWGREAKVKGKERDKNDKSEEESAIKKIDSVSLWARPKESNARERRGREGREGEREAHPRSMCSMQIQM